MRNPIGSRSIFCSVPLFLFSFFLFLIRAFCLFKVNGICDRQWWIKIDSVEKSLFIQWNDNRHHQSLLLRYFFIYLTPANAAANENEKSSESIANGYGTPCKWYANEFGKSMEKCEQWLVTASSLSVNVIHKRNIIKMNGNGLRCFSQMIFVSAAFPLRTLHTLQMLFMLRSVMDLQVLTWTCMRPKCAKTDPGCALKLIRLRVTTKNGCVVSTGPSVRFAPLKILPACALNTSTTQKVFFGLVCSNPNQLNIFTLLACAMCIPWPFYHLAPETI